MIYKGSVLKWILPHIYLLTDTGKKVYIISPWIDARVKIYVSWYIERPERTLKELANLFARKGVRTVFVFSEDERNNDINKRSESLLDGNAFEILYIKGLHAKAVIGQRLMYLGSANITFSGIYRNTEAANLEIVKDQQESLAQIFGERELWQLRKMK